MSILTQITKRVQLENGVRDLLMGMWTSGIGNKELIEILNEIEVWEVCTVDIDEDGTIWVNGDNGREDITEFFTNLI